MKAALVFDLDGTLVDTAPDLLEALNALLGTAGRPQVGIADLRHLVGYGARTMIGEAFRMTGDAVDETRVPALVDDFIVHYREHLADHSRPFPGVETTLAALARDGFTMGVLTNKPHELALPLLRKLGLDRFFGAIHGAGRYFYVKPDPRVFHHVMDELGGGRAVMIGDSKTDVVTARAAKVPVILMSYGYTPEPVHGLGADAVLDEFTDLPGLIARLPA